MPLYYVTKIHEVTHKTTTITTTTTTTTQQPFYGPLSGTTRGEPVPEETTSGESNLTEGRITGAHGRFNRIC